MTRRNKSAKGKKRDILIASVLVIALLIGVAVLILVEGSVGTPVYIDGNLTSIKVSITEICTSNRTVIATDDGLFPDYIELHNEGDSFNLKGFGISLQANAGIVYSFGDMVFEKDSYLLVFADGKNVPFKLSAQGGEYVGLLSKDGTVVASTTTVASDADEAIMLLDGKYTLSKAPSPGYANTEEGRAAFLDSVIDRENNLVINEILTSNQSVLPDFQGDFGDIVELKNISSAIISTEGYYISDSMEDRYTCPLPKKELAPGEIMIIFASGKDRSTGSEFHSDFRLSKEESVIISAGAKYYSMEVSSCQSNCSTSRIQSEQGVEYVEMAATPGFENDDAGREELEISRIDKNAPIVISEILLSRDEAPYKGSLRDVIELCNISDAEVSTKGWYISDSEEEPYRYALPEKTLAPNECMVLFAESGEGKNVCNFSLSSRESVYLTTPQFKRSELVSCASAGIGKSRNRTIDKEEVVYVSGAPSIGFPNGDSGVAAFASAIRPSDVEISEIVSSNSKYYAGPYGTYHDFVELHNRTSDAIDLTGYYLSDSPEEPRRGALDGVSIPANGYVIIILSSDGVNVPDGYHWVEFSLSSSGEVLTLSKGDEIVDYAVVPSLAKNTSYGRPNGSDVFAVLESVTAKKANSARAASKAAAPQALTAQGKYDQGTLSVELKGEGSIYYTLDCSEPTAASTLYTAPIKLSKTSVIRCCSIAEGKPMSEILDLTYIINEPDTLETISIVTTPENLFDHYTGIYATGPKASSAFPYNGANYYNRWEREATVSFFDSEGGGFSEPCGIRIFGGLSRALPKKSFACFFRTAYGNGQLDYKLFDDYPLNSYESFVLRNTGQDYRHSSMRDAMITSMARDFLGIDVQNCRPVVVYINGEYWGLYFIREKLNEHYVAGHYNVDSSKAEVAVANGNRSEAYMALVDYAASHDLSVKEHYEHVCSLMDVENYIDYHAAQMIIANTDNGNIRFFTYEGGKWRWIMYDVDQSFRSANYDTIAEHLNPKGTGGGDNFSTRLINALMKNPEFKEKFLREMAYQLENVWNEKNVNAYVDEFSQLIADEMPRECQRWEKDYDAWVNSVKSLRTFAKNREAYVIKYVKSYFSLSDSQMKEYGFNI